MNIVFAGTPDFAASSLQALISNKHQISAVYTQPDRPAGRGKKVLKSPVKDLAESHNIPVLQPEKLTSEAAIEALRQLKPDLMIVAAYGLLLPQEVLDIPTYGCINIHASLLPRWRGAAPIQRAIQAGDSETGITIMQMDIGLDTGNMLLKKVLPITADETGGHLHDQLATLGAECILEYLASREALGTGEVQDDSLSNYASKLSKKEADIDWSLSAIEIERTIRAFNPWPVAFTNVETTKGIQRVRIYQAEADTKETSEAPGTIIDKHRNGITVSCGSGTLAIKSLQLPGAKVISSEDFANGNQTLLDPNTRLQNASQL